MVFIPQGYRCNVIGFALCKTTRFFFTQLESVAAITTPAGNRKAQKTRFAGGRVLVRAHDAVALISHQVGDHTVVAGFAKSPVLSVVGAGPKRDVHRADQHFVNVSAGAT